MIKSLLRGIQHNKNAILRFNHSKAIRSIRMAHSTTQANLYSDADESAEIMALWPGIVADLTKGKYYRDIPEARERMAKVLNYAVPGGKLHRSLGVMHAYRMLARPEQLTHENLTLARIVGWCMEISQAYLQMEDDLMDNSKTRRGQPCWYLHENNGVAAVNDSFILQQAGHLLLKIHFNKHDCYLKLLESFKEMEFHVVMGQVLDATTSNSKNKPDINHFDMDRWNIAAKYKGSIFCFVMPVKFAMFLTARNEPEILRQIEPILLDIGELYTAQNDYLDCYGDPNATGHIGRDIEEGKYTWLAIKALQHANADQKKRFTECYGYNDPEKVAYVKQIYDELDLPSIYANYEDEAYNSIKTQVERITCDFPKEYFDALLGGVYRRTT